VTTSAADLFLQYADSLPLPGREMTSAGVEAGQQARRELLARGAGAVGALVDALTAGDFSVQDAAYDLILDMGEPVRDSVRAELGRRDPVTDIWLAVLLHQLGESDALERLRALLADPDARVRHLAALASAFHGDGSLEPVPVLLEALDDDTRIDGTPFTVAGSALAMLSRLAGISLLPGGAEVHLYNYDDFAYPPPLHPFPYAADVLTHLDAAARADVVRQARAWWADHAGKPGR
jgi:hypothetical protein